MYMYIYNIYVYTYVYICHSIMYNIFNARKKLSRFPIFGLFIPIMQL